MTCGEFKAQIASLPLQQACEPQEQALAHERQCPACATWRHEHSSLAAAMHGLKLKTASCEAGPNVERELLRAFRQHPSESAGTPAAPRFTFAFRLSRWFEVGAYAAAAAAILIALLVGYKLLRQPAPAAVLGSGHVSAQPAEPRLPAAQPDGQVDPGQRLAGSSSELRAANGNRVRTGSSRLRQKQAVGSAAAAEDTATEQALAGANYVSLMFCDPISCSGDAQVVRMEVPVRASSGQSQQSVMADVVVGDDGLVRAVRFVN